MAENGGYQEEGSSSGSLPPTLVAISPGAGSEASPLCAVSSSSFTHTPFYCEENVYLLCKKLSLIGVAVPEVFDLFVVFISNVKKQVPLWYQKASKRIDGLVLWDYHVICVQSRRNGEDNIHHLVWDLDSRLPFPSPLNHYVNATFQPLLPSTYNRLFRVVHAPIFLRCFASDRSHMKDNVGNLISPPPTYNPLAAEDGTVNNIDEYIQICAADMVTNMTQLVDCVFTKKLGVVVDETQLEDLFSHICRLLKINVVIGVVKDLVCDDRSHQR